MTSASVGRKGTVMRSKTVVCVSLKEPCEYPIQISDKCVFDAYEETVCFELDENVLDSEDIRQICRAQIIGLVE